MKSILIVDDHFVLRYGLRSFLQSNFAPVTVGEAQDASEALQSNMGEWDLVLLDIALPGRSGLDLLEELKQKNAKLPVLVLSIYPEDRYAIRALKLGAAGYLNKASKPEDFLEAIKQVLSGGRYITPSLAERLALNLANDTDCPLHENLSNREYEVMCLIASGKTVTEVGRKLSLSVKTISTYRAHILDKMMLRNNAEIMRYAVEHKLSD